MSKLNQKMEKMALNMVMKLNRKMKKVILDKKMNMNKKRKFDKNKSKHMVSSEGIKEFTCACFAWA